MVKFLFSSFPIHSHLPYTSQPYKHIYPPPHTHPTHKNTPTSPPQFSKISWNPCFGFKTYSQLQLIRLLDLIKFDIRNKFSWHNLINRWRGWVALIRTSSIFYKDDVGRVWFEYLMQYTCATVLSCRHIDNSHIWRPKECMLWQIFLSLHVWQFSMSW